MAEDDVPMEELVRTLAEEVPMEELVRTLAEQVPPPVVELGRRAVVMWMIDELVGAAAWGMSPDADPKADEELRELRRLRERLNGELADVAPEKYSRIVYQRQHLAWGPQHQYFEDNASEIAERVAKRLVPSTPIHEPHTTQLDPNKLPYQWPSGVSPGATSKRSGRLELVRFPDSLAAGTAQCPDAYLRRGGRVKDSEGVLVFYQDRVTFYADSGQTSGEPYTCPGFTEVGDHHSDL